MFPYAGLANYVGGATLYVTERAWASTVCAWSAVGTFLLAIGIHWILGLHQWFDVHPDSGSTVTKYNLEFVNGYQNKQAIPILINISWKKYKLISVVLEIFHISQMY